MDWARRRIRWMQRPAGEVGGLAGGLDRFQRLRDERRAAPGVLEVGARTDRLEVPAVGGNRLPPAEFWLDHRSSAPGSG